MNDDTRFAIELWLGLMGVCLAIVGMCFGMVSFLKYGVTWWNVPLTLGGMFGCCVPRLLAWNDDRKELKTKVTEGSSK